MALKKVAENLKRCIIYSPNYWALLSSVFTKKYIKKILLKIFVLFSSAGGGLHCWTLSSPCELILQPWQDVPHF
jgi:hypothetical protein